MKNRNRTIEIKVNDNTRTFNTRQELESGLDTFTEGRHIAMSRAATKSYNQHNCSSTKQSFE